MVYIMSSWSDWYLYFQNIKYYSYSVHLVLCKLIFRRDLCYHFSFVVFIKSHQEATSLTRKHSVNHIFTWFGKASFLPCTFSVVYVQANQEATELKKWIYNQSIPSLDILFDLLIYIILIRSNVIKKLGFDELIILSRSLHIYPTKYQPWNLSHCYS